MTVRAKFKCDSIQPAPGGEGKEIKMSAVHSGSAENDSFFKFTPSGQLHLATVNHPAADRFEVGKEYYIDISPAE